MKAIQLHGFGNVQNLKPVEVDIPEPQPGQVLVKISCSGVNPIDIKIRSLAPPFAPPLPFIPGMDMAGTVEKVGEGVTEFKPGDEVYGCVGGLVDLPGTLAEYVTADARLMALKPKNLSMREAAALPLVTITAYMAIHERMKVVPGMDVLIHGGAGGVGHVAIQLAKAAGATVATTVSGERKAELAISVGAQNIIYYKTEPVTDYVQLLTENGFDAVFDTVGGSNLDNSFIACAPEGVVASTNTRSTHDLTILHAKGLTLSVIFMLLPMISNEGRERYRTILDEARLLAEAGKLRPIIDPSEFKLEDAAQAQTLVETGKSLGKVVVEI